MVGVFSRSFSFPNKINPNRPSKPPISHHTRCVSLPCRSHPLISHLKDEINDLKSWSNSKPETRNSAWICDGLSRLKDLHDSLDDLLQIPQTQESLRRQPYLVENLLEDFLKFVDVYGIFRTSVLSFNEEVTASQVGIRKRDDLKAALYIKARKRLIIEMNKLVSTVRSISVPAPALITVGDAEVAGVTGDVVEVTALVSTTLFNGISSSFGARKSWRSGLGLSKKVKVEGGIEEFEKIGAESLLELKKKKDEEIKMVLKRMQELESCIGRIESCSERVFRGLIKSKVSLLNTLTDR
ncbi:hypothetical protein HS088_TW11G01016 [Tripterygium wilfordii]|uniref:DUF241 domain protein n=1 Tax=Tripterygium wilfordii TaxID=458696 RepID=A0A7J7D3K7_TRIWF|nr:uncharacterized protein LOC120009604 [Tripterygium wilfordii]KAF5740934.1 hypothetical protein HS088_TW11G01016 [Tripterygium wilfordii]